MKMAAICTNCNKNVDAGTSTSTLSTQMVSDTGIGEFRIWDVIAYVYRIGSISLDDFKIHFKDVISQKDYLLKDFMEESLGMCDLCLSLLFDTYKTFKKFESLTQQESFIHQFQNTCAKKWKTCIEADPLAPSTFSDDNSLIPSTPVENKNEEIFDEFKCNDDHPLNEPDISFAKECKLEADDDLFQNESPSSPLQEATPRINQKQNMSKQLVVKVEKVSEENIKHFKEKKQTKTTSTAEVVKLKRRKVKPMRKLSKLQCSIKAKYSPKQRKIEQLPIVRRKKTYECKICGKVFAEKRYLRKVHMPVHFQDMTCKLCKKTLTSLKSFEMHMKMVHKEANGENLDAYYKACKICGKTILARNLPAHIRRHGPRKAFKCDKCDKEYFNKRAYEDHIQTHSDNFTPYLCGHCGATFNDPSSLRVHERKHTEGKKFSCDLCTIKFYVKKELERHKSSVHSNERKFVCDECGVTYKRKCDLQRHKKIHQAVAEKGEYSSKCQYCERIFKHAESLRVHMQSHERIFECSFCGKKLSKPDVLRKHEELHKKNPNYQPRKYKTWKTDIARQPKPSEYGTSSVTAPCT